ncbi:MAG: plastocyanin/azurin family copper-binding protein [Actinomycetota bacterium]
MRASARVIVALTLAVGGLVTIGATAAVGGGCHPPTNKLSAAKGAGDVLVPIGECQFVPTVVYVDPGTRVTWVNKDPVPHTVTGALMAWGSVEPLDQGNRSSYRFEEEGVYPYQCYLHPSMAGAVVVGDVNALKSGLSPVVSAPEVEPIAKPPAPVNLDDKKDDAVNLPGMSLSAAALILGATRLLSRRNTL